MKGERKRADLLPAEFAKALNNKKMNIDKYNEQVMPQRAPQKREAPVPLRGPIVRRAPDVPISSRLQNLFKNRKVITFENSTGFHGGPSARRKGYRLALWSLLASFIDGLILISASCVFLTMFSLIVKTSFGSLASDLIQSQNKGVLFVEVFFIFGWVYMISIRSLMGSTVGEWSCDIRLGRPHERLQTSYIFKVAFRSTLILLTGVITLPLLSLVFARDVAGTLSGLRLFSLK